MSTISTLILIFISCWCSFVSGANLYPSCGGEERQASAMAGKEVTLYRLPTWSQNLTVSCLAYEVTTLKGGVGKGNGDPCEVAHQTEYLYRLVVRATQYDKNGRKANISDFDVKDVAGGSLDSIAIRLSENSEFSLVFMNKGKNERCSLKVRAIFDYKQTAKITENNLLPVVISVIPRTVYIKRTSKTQIILRYPNGTDMRSTDEDDVTLEDTKTECADVSSSLRHMSLPSVPPELDSFDNPSTLAVRDFYFDRPETYRICYRAKGDNQSSELAVVRVFDGNPSYYSIINGQDKDGHIFVGVQTTMKFHGYDLDTRPGGDKAKFVRETEECATGAPAGGVAEATDLGPSDDYGPGTTYTLWTWELKEGGAFKICYKRRDGMWTEVPSITDVNPTSLPGPNETNIPRPTDPATHQECPMAPPNTPENPWMAYKSIRITLIGKEMSDAYFKSLSNIFCIPRAAFSVTHMTHNLKGQQVLYISILCEDLGPSSPCNTLERQNYIVSLGRSNSTILSDAGIESVEGSNHMFAAGDDPVFVKGYGSHILAITITCGTLLLVTAMTVYGVLKYRENRQYFIQFGTDEGEVEDMYPEDGHMDREDARRRAVKNAVIELEE